MRITLSVAALLATLVVSNSSLNCAETIDSFRGIKWYTTYEKAIESIDLYSSRVDVDRSGGKWLFVDDYMFGIKGKLSYLFRDDKLAFGMWSHYDNAAADKERNILIIVRKLSAKYGNPVVMAVNNRIGDYHGERKFMESLGDFFSPNVVELSWGDLIGNQIRVTVSKDISVAYYSSWQLNSNKAHEDH